MGDKSYAVYKHTCPNNKVYIGITSRTLYERFGHKGYKYKTQIFYRAILKYGWDNILHEVLFEGLTKEEACKKEEELIKLYKSNEQKYGYNQSVGGESGTKGYSFTEEQRLKLSKKRKGKKLSEEARRNISEAKKGSKNPNWGKHPSEETMKIYREIRRKENLSAETREKLSNSHKKPIKCIELNKVFDSLKIAGEITGVLPTSICKVLKNVKNHNTAGGYHWEYIEEVK